MIIAYNLDQWNNPEVPDLAKTCLFRIGKAIKSLNLTNNSRGVLYQTGTQMLVGELGITRIANIEEPENAELKKLYQKLTARPVAPSEEGYLGPGHIFYNELNLYYPRIEWSKFNSKVKERTGKNYALPIRSFIYIDDDILEVIHELTSIVKVQKG
jgi:hypothetical protein